MELSLLHRKEGIIISTIEAMHKVGIHNLSTKIIAEYQGVSEGTIFRHFKNKTEIMTAVLEFYSQYDNDIIQAAANRKLHPMEAISYFINAYAEYYQNYPEITVIVNQYESLSYEPELSSLMQAIADKRFKYILYEIKKAQHLGLLENSVDARVIATLIVGGFKELCLRWRAQNYSFSLKEQASIMILTMLDAFCKKCS